MGFPCGSVLNNLPDNAGDTGLIPGLGRSPGEENGNLLQYSCLENPMDREAWWATVCGVKTEWLSMHTHTHTHTHTQSMDNIRRNVDTMLIHRDGDKRLRNPLRLVREEDFNSFSTWGSHIYQSNRTLTEVRLYGWLTVLRVIKERNKKKRACFEGKQHSGWLQPSTLLLQYA